MAVTKVPVASFSAQLRGRDRRRDCARLIFRSLRRVCGVAHVHRDRSLQLHFVQHRAHRADVIGRGAAAAADDRSARLQETPRKLAEVFGRGRIDQARAHVLRPAGIGLNRHERAAVRLQRVARESQHHRQQSGRADAAIRADHIDFEFAQFARHLLGHVAQRRAAVFGERHLSDDGQAGIHFACSPNRLYHLVEVAERLYHQRVDVRFIQRGDLFLESSECLAGADAAQRRKAHPQRPDRSGHKDLAARFIGRFARQPRPRPVDLRDPVVQMVFQQAEAIAAEGVGFQQVSACFHVDCDAR